MQKFGIETKQDRWLLINCVRAFGWSFTLFGLVCLGPSLTTATEGCEYPTHVFFGVEDFGGFGESVAFAGDVDNDTYDDIIIGAPSSGTNGGGEVFVYSGLTGRQIYLLRGLGYR